MKLSASPIRLGFGQLTARLTFRLAFCALAASSALLTIFNCEIAESSKPKPLEYLECGTRPEMGTPFKICLVIQAHQQAKAREDIALAFKEIGRINSWMSDWLPETELSQVNQFAGEKPVKVGRELLGVLSDTLSVARDSGGAAGSVGYAGVALSDEDAARLAAAARDRRRAEAAGRGRTRRRR